MLTLAKLNIESFFHKMRPDTDYDFARQFALNRSRDVVEAYYEATKRPYTYILFDMHMETPPEIQIRTNVLPVDGYNIVYRRT